MDGERNSVEKQRVEGRKKMVETIRLFETRDAINSRRDDRDPDPSFVRGFRSIIDVSFARPFC